MRIENEDCGAQGPIFSDLECNKIDPKYKRDIYYQLIRMC